MSWTPEQITETLRAVVERSLTDPKFRDLATKDARAAVAQVSASPVPAALTIRFVDNGGYDMTIVLPDVPKQATGELEEAELTGVAGAGYGLGGAPVAVANTSAYACIR